MTTPDVTGLQKLQESVEEAVQPERKPRKQKGYSFPDSQRSVHLAVPPTTTEQQDITTAGQRKVNLIWEYTQASISIIVVMANMAVAVYQGFVKEHGEFPAVLQNTLFLVVGFYFSRTNHSAIGGVGPKPEVEYKGR